MLFTVLHTFYVIIILKKIFLTSLVIESNRIEKSIHIRESTPIDFFSLNRTAIVTREHSDNVNQPRLVNTAIPEKQAKKIRLSATSRCSTETAKGRITQITPHDSQGLWLMMPKISAKLKRGHPQRRRQNAGGVVQIIKCMCIGSWKLATFDAKRC